MNRTFLMISACLLSACSHGGHVRNAPGVISKWPVLLVKVRSDAHYYNYTPMYPWNGWYALPYRGSGTTPWEMHGELDWKILGESFYIPNGTSEHLIAGFIVKAPKIHLDSWRKKDMGPYDVIHLMGMVSGDGVPFRKVSSGELVVDDRSEFERKVFLNRLIRLNPQTASGFHIVWPDSCTDDFAANLNAIQKRYGVLRWMVSLNPLDSERGGIPVFHERN